MNVGNLALQIDAIADADDIQFTRESGAKHPVTALAARARGSSHAAAANESLSRTNVQRAVVLLETNARAESGRSTCLSVLLPQLIADVDLHAGGQRNWLFTNSRHVEIS